MFKINHATNSIYVGHRYFLLNYDAYMQLVISYF